ncbi:DUF305 domain-containing protein [Maricaulis sp.]|uniref:DUF305 domain-containing protein n=1 Tax=Maricaulis sp. TaxID=1486257 RepID=UPI002614B6AB|nr:DUF305 domain-containing protein [Maricaulis sp.]
MMRCGWAVLAAAAIAFCVFAAPVGAQSGPGAAPIFQPGAPGQPSRQISREESLELGQSRYVAADVRFMQHMIVHHNQAVEMGDLVAGRTENPSVIGMAERIALTQASEMDMMRTWLTRRGESTAMDMSDHAHMDHGEMDHSDMDHSAMDHAAMGHGSDHEALSDVPLMPGMLSPRQMAELAAASGEGFDRLYLTGMIHHHQGAIDMVNALLAEPGAAEDPEMSGFVSDVITDQTTEIMRMRAMLAELG